MAAPLTKNLIVLGAPGVGKGTQAKKLSKDYSWIHLSTGDMLREAMRDSTLLGERAKNYVESGDLVPDELIVELMEERLGQDDCRYGFLLDGFPRTITQAKQLDDVLTRLHVELDGVLCINVPDEEIVDRLSQRFTCQSCGSIVVGGEGVGSCPECGGKIIRRKDDEPETIRHRLKVYSENTQPLIDYYREQNLLFEINGMGSIEDIYHRALSELGIS